MLSTVWHKVVPRLNETQDAGRMQFTVPVPSLPNGVHFLRLREGGQTVKPRTLIVVE